MIFTKLKIMNSFLRASSAPDVRCHGERIELPIGSDCNRRAIGAVGIENEENIFIFVVTF